LIGQSSNSIKIEELVRRVRKRRLLLPLRDGGGLVVTVGSLR
jgi:hypothetical protein